MKKSAVCLLIFIGLFVTAGFASACAYISSGTTTIVGTITSTSTFVVDPSATMPTSTAMGYYWQDSLGGGGGTGLYLDGCGDGFDLSEFDQYETSTPHFLKITGWGGSSFNGGQGWIGFYNIGEQYYVTDVSLPCSYWTDYANCIWEGNPVYPTGFTGTGNCLWNDDTEKCYSTSSVSNTDWNFVSNYPAECYWNSEEWAFATTASGSFTVPYNLPYDDIVFNKLLFTGMNHDDGQFYYASTTFYKTAGETENFSIPYSFPSSTIFGIAFNYVVGGYRTSDPNQQYTQLFACDTSYLGQPSSSTLELLECDVAILGPECSTISWVTDGFERLSCEIGETFKGTFIPSCSKRAELDKWMALTKTRAPYNYVSKLSNFLGGFVFVTTTDTTTITQISDGMKSFTFFRIFRDIIKVIFYLIFGFALYKITTKMFK